MDVSGRITNLSSRWRELETPRKFAYVLAAVVILVIIWTLATAPARNAAADAERQERTAALVAALTPREVVYEVEGDGRYFDMTAETPTGTTQASPDLPLRLTTGGLVTHEFDPGSFVYISAQSKDGRSITCRITVDGEVISDNTATGEFAIATCKGSA